MNRSIKFSFALLMLISVFLFPSAALAASNAPPSPKSIKVKISAEYVKVSWDKSKGAYLYRIYRSEKKSSGYTKVGETNKLSFVDKKVKLKKSYYYKIKALSKSHKASGYSKISGKISTPISPVITMMGDKYIQAIMDGINEYREFYGSDEQYKDDECYGAQPAKTHPKLNEIAAVHAKKLAERGNGRADHSDNMFSETVGTVLTKDLNAAYNEGAASTAHTTDFLLPDRQYFGIGAAWRNDVMYFVIIAPLPSQHDDLGIE